MKKTLYTLLVTLTLVTGSVLKAQSPRQMDALCYPSYDYYADHFASQGYINNRALAWYYLGSRCQEWIPQPSWSGDLWAQVDLESECLEQLEGILEYYGYNLQYAPAHVWRWAIAGLDPECREYFGY